MKTTLEKTSVKQYEILVGGEWEKSGRTLEVINPFDGRPAALTYAADAAQLERAVKKLQDSFALTRRLPSYERSRILSRIAVSVEAHRDDLAATIAVEAGKPLKDSAREVERAVLTLQTAAEEAKRIPGEVMSLDLAAGAEERFGIVRRYPIGPVLAITPFNFPLNLAVHKLAPAIAVGNPILVKPASKTPVVMLKLARLVLEAGWPKEALSVFPLAASSYDRLVADERFKLLTFTGSQDVGWQIKAKAGKKKVVLELGGNASAIIDEGASAAFAAKRVAAGAFALAGQSCISVQRVYVHESLKNSFTQELLNLVQGLKVGDPMDPAVDVGPMIDAASAQKTKAWLEEAVKEGAKILCGGGVNGTIMQPTVLASVNPLSKVCAEEAFAPLVCLFPFNDFEDALRQANDSRFGLQAGVFTPSLEHALAAFERLEVGGVMINEVPTWRMDPMPYGGVKDSGLGREGVKYSIECMSEPKLMVLNRRCP
ncbi:MAG: aldehyde dehydrogenase [Elusimicrobia bacterium RIFCSPLOWO2_12_FULL_59_9]|nr:MAG: aldehyde dehydrogenase [Elusimicrobia bacterium RIFCSPLOWO2_12_FULL_59_9]